MVLVPANMSRFGLSPCNFFLLFLVLVPDPTLVMICTPHFSDDLHTLHMMTVPIY